MNFIVDVDEISIHSPKASRSHFLQKYVCLIHESIRARLWFSYATWDSDLMKEIAATFNLFSLVRKKLNVHVMSLIDLIELIPSSPAAI